MTDFLASPCIPAAGLLLLACGARLVSRSWLAPSPFALSIWSAYLIIPLVLTPEYKSQPIGAWVILVLVLCVAIGAHLGARRDEGKAPKGKTSGARIHPLLNFSLFLSGLSLMGALYSAAKALADYSLDLSLPSFLALGHLLSVERYSGEQTPLLVRALIIWVFPAAFLGGMSFAKARTRYERLICLAPLVPALLFSLIQGARANTWMVIALGLSGYLAMRVTVSKGAYRPASRKGILVATGCGIAGLAFFFVVDALRSHHREQDLQVDTDWGRAKSSSLGYLAAFSHWANSREGLDYFDFGVGAYTFGGLLDLTGLHPRRTGVYAESIELEGGNDSNIYTAFRGLIEDFSLPGASIFCLLVGFSAGHAYRNSLLGRTAWAPGLAAFYAFLFWSPIGSLFVYNGPILAVVVSIFALRGTAKGAHRRAHSLANSRIKLGRLDALGKQR